MINVKHNNQKSQIKECEKKQLHLSRISGSSICPFCRGSKSTPFVRYGKPQDCKECDDDKINWFKYINFAGTPHDLEYIEKLK